MCQSPENYQALSIRSVLSLFLFVSCFFDPKPQILHPNLNLRLNVMVACAHSPSNKEAEGW